MGVKKNVGILGYRNEKSGVFLAIRDAQEVIGGLLKSSCRTLALSLTGNLKALREYG